MNNVIPFPRHREPVPLPAAVGAIIAAPARAYDGPPLTVEAIAAAILAGMVRTDAPPPEAA